MQPYRLTGKYFTSLLQTNFRYTKNFKAFTLLILQKKRCKINKEATESQKFYLFSLIMKDLLASSLFLFFHSLSIVSYHFL